MRTPTTRPALVAVTLAGLLLASACTSVFDLKVGDCFNASEGETQSTVQTVACADPHTYEVYAVFDYQAGTDDAFPGDTAISTFAESECEARFEPWVGKTYAESELYVYYLSPSSDTWETGDREVICAVYLPDGQLTGTQQGSAR